MATTLQCSLKTTAQVIVLKPLCQRSNLYFILIGRMDSTFSGSQDLQWDWEKRKRGGGGEGVNISGFWNSLWIGTFQEQGNLNITQVLWHGVKVGQSRVYTNTSSVLRLAWGWWWDWVVGWGDSHNTTTVLTPHSAIKQKRSLMAQGSTTESLPAEWILPA